MSKNDVWRELEERLKQKAKFAQDICHAISEAWRSWELQEKLEMEEWVRLEDVGSAIQQLKQNYAIIRKEDLASIIELFKSSPFVLTDPLIRRLEELLRKNEGC